MYKTHLLLATTTFKARWRLSLSSLSRCDLHRRGSKYRHHRFTNNFSDSLFLLLSLLKYPKNDRIENDRRSMSVILGVPLTSLKRLIGSALPNENPSETLSEVVGSTTGQGSTRIAAAGGCWFYCKSKTQVCVCKLQGEKRKMGVSVLSFFVFGLDDWDALML